MNLRTQIAIVIFLIVFIIGCIPNPEVRFLEPQPTERKDLNTFPRKYQGKYLGKLDSSILTISSKSIVQEFNGFARVSDVEMEQEFDTIFIDNVEIELWNNYRMRIEVDGDSASITTYGIDTLFQIEEKALLRKFKGYLFLNSQKNDLTWSVKTMKLENGELDIKKLVNLSKIDSLIPITNVKISIDSTSKKINSYDLKPRKKELKELLRRKSKKSSFIKIE